MTYPKSLEQHLVPQYDYLSAFSDKSTDASYVYSYYHDKTQFPLLMHKHNFYEINIVTSGNGRHYIENNSFYAESGCVFILPPQIGHGYYTNTGMDIFHMALNAEFMREFHSQLAALPGYSLLFEIEPKLREQVPSDSFFLHLNVQELDQLKPELETLVSCETFDYAGISTIKKSKAVALIGMLAMYMTVPRQSNSENSSFSLDCFYKGIEYIKNNFNEKLSVDALAKMCGMSYSTFTRYIKKIYNMSPTVYIMKLRINHAKKMLSSTNLPISHIAQDCGFFDLSHMERYFKHFEGVTPFAYRKSSDKHT